MVLSMRYGVRTRGFLARHEMQETCPMARRLETLLSPGLLGFALPSFRDCFGGSIVLRGHRR